MVYILSQSNCVSNLKFMKVVSGILILLHIAVSSFGQDTLRKKDLTDKIAWDNFLVIRIDNAAERYTKKEVHVIYHHENVLKIHSISKSNYLKDIQVDTVFTLNAKQLKVIDDFYVRLNSPKPPTAIIIAGTTVTYSITLNGETSTFINKYEFSLIDEILKL